MGHVNLPPSRRSSGPHRQWSLLDLACFSFFAGVVIFFLLVFTSLGDSLAASGRRSLARSNPGQRDRILAFFDSPYSNSIIINNDHNSGGSGEEAASVAASVVIEACPAEEVDEMPCEDPRWNSQLSRDMNFYRERHCPPPDELPLCLVPPPEGYRIPVPWPDSLHKVSLLYSTLSLSFFLKFFFSFSFLFYSSAAL